MSSPKRCSEGIWLPFLNDTISANTTAGIIDRMNVKTNANLLRVLSGCDVRFGKCNNAIDASARHDLVVDTAPPRRTKSSLAKPNLRQQAI